MTLLISRQGRNS